MTTCFQLVLRGMVEGIEAVRKGGECLDGGVREHYFDHIIIKLIELFNLLLGFNETLT